MSSFKFSFAFECLPVLKSNGEEYHFPDDYKLIDVKYAVPAVYKWTVYNNEKDDLKIVYIGETEILRKRISGYLKPGPTQQTNIRLNKKFNEFISKGNKIALEILSIENINLNGITISEEGISDSNIRVAIEQLFIASYKRDNYTLLNQ